MPSTGWTVASCASPARTPFFRISLRLRSPSRVSQDTDRPRKGRTTVGEQDQNASNPTITRRRLLAGTAGLAGLALIGCRTTSGPTGGPTGSGAAANRDLTVITGAE